jgi:hypothetical protein
MAVTITFRKLFHALLLIGLTILFMHLAGSIDRRYAHTMEMETRFLRIQGDLVYLRWESLDRERIELERLSRQRKLTPLELERLDRIVHQMPILTARLEQIEKVLP